MDVVCTGDDQSLDGTHPVPSFPTAACGRTFTADLTLPWDVRTDADGKVIGQHRDVRCPDCGATTFIVKGD